MGAPTGSQARWVGRKVPTVAAHPGEYIDGADRPGEAREARGSQGEVIPTVAAPESPPDQILIPVCYPDHPRSLLPATQPYLE